MRKCNVVEDGYERAVAAIRAQVVAEFAERMAAASFWQRFQIRREINAEVQRRLRKSAPPGALYVIR